MPYESLIKRGQKEIKKGNDFASNIPRDTKVSKTQLSKITKSGRFLGALVGKLLSLLDHKEQIFLVSFHSLSNIEIIQYFNCKPTFNGVYERDNFLRVEEEAYFLNFDDAKK